MWTLNVEVDGGKVVEVHFVEVVAEVESRGSGFVVLDLAVNSKSKSR